MATILAFKDKFDIPEWRILAIMPASFSSAGMSLAADPRGNGDADPYTYMLGSSTTFYKFLARTNEWLTLASPALAGSLNAGTTMIFHPTQGPRGTLTSGNTTTKVVLSTALPAAVGINQLANRGDGVGYKIRIIGNASGSSGKTEERTIVGNSGGTTPTLWLDSALTFSPASGDAYEIIAGRVFMLNPGAPQAGQWKYFDVATNSFSGNLATTNLPTVGTDSAMVAFSEANVPNTRNPGEGFFGTLTATGTAAGTLTGQAASGDAGVAANDYRNFQLRIIQDTSTPTAVGQRRRITSHTAGASPVYTLASNWTVTPSSSAQYVVEWDDDKVLMWGSGNSNTYTYNITANTWDTTTFGAAGGNHGAGVMAFGSWGITPDAGSNAKPSMIHVFRGGATTTLDVLDIAGGSAGSWDNGVTYGSSTTTLTTGACGVYDPNTNNGRYAYIAVNLTQRFMRYDVRNRTLEPYAYMPLAFSVGGVTGRHLELCTFVDGSTKMTGLNFAIPGSTTMVQCWAHN